MTLTRVPGALVTNDTARIDVLVGGVLVGNSNDVNLIQGTGINLGAEVDSNGVVEVTISATAGVPTTITVADTTDTTCYVALFQDATGDLAPKTDAGLTYNATTGMLTATGFTGPLTGNVTGNVSGTSGSTTGNAATATALQTARSIGGVNFDGTGNIVPQTIQSVNEASDTTCFPLFISASGSQSLQPLNNTSFTFNASNAHLGAGAFVVSSTSAPSNGIYLNTTNVLGFAVNSAAEMALSATALYPTTSDGTALGGTANQWSDLYLASGALIDFANNNARITHSTGALAVSVPLTANSFIPSSSTVPTNGLYLSTTNTLGFGINSAAELLLDGTSFRPATSDGNALGSSTNMWSDLYLASGGFIDFNNNDIRITHSANTLTFSGASSGYIYDAANLPSANDGAALGSASVSWSDLFLASGALINFANSDVTITHATNQLNFAGATTNGYRFADGPIAPASSDGSALGTTALMWSDLFLASGGVINFNAGDVLITHSSNTLAFTGASSGYTFDAAISVSGSPVVITNVATAFSAQQNFASAALTSGTNISWNLATQQAARLTIAHAATLSNPTNMVNGGTYVLVVTQDGTGGRTLAYGSAYKWPSGTAFVLSTAIGAVDILTFISDGTNMYGVGQKSFA